MSTNLFLIGFLLFILVLVIIFIIKLFVKVPPDEVIVVERLGRFMGIYESGVHILVPFIDRVAYRYTLKEETLDIPKQNCITSDNITVAADAVLQIKINDPQKVSYSIENYRNALVLLTQTTMRNVIGKFDYRKLLSETDSINYEITGDVASACDPWGIDLIRFEVRNIEEE